MMPRFKSDGHAGRRLEASGAPTSLLFHRAEVVPSPLTSSSVAAYYSSRDRERDHFPISASTF